jgi:hypothetical protein
MPHSETYIDGIWYPSVTTIMSAKPMPWLDMWREKWGILADRKMKLSSEIGTEFHRCIESYINTGSYTVEAPVVGGVDGWEIPSVIPRIEGMMRSFVEWAKSVDAGIHQTELKVISRRYVYSGTLDAVGTLNGRPMLFDWKTSSRIYDDMQLQLAAYAEAYNEGYQSEPWHKTSIVKNGLIVQVSKDKPHFKLTIKQFKLGKRSFKQFLKLRAMFDDMKAIEAEALK